VNLGNPEEVSVYTAKQSKPANSSDIFCPFQSDAAFPAHPAMKYSNIIDASGNTHSEVNWNTYGVYL